MNSCGFTRANQCHTFATEVVMDDFESCKYMSNEDPVESFKTFSDITATQGQISVMPVQKNNIKAFTRWLKDQFRMGIDPTTLPFPQYDTAYLLRQSKTHQLFVYKSYTISKDEKSVRLTKQVKWEDWAPTFMKYAGEMPVKGWCTIEIHHYR